MMVRAMRRVRCLVLATALGASPLNFLCEAQMYTDAPLAAKRARIEENATYTVQKDIPASAPLPQRAAAARARLRTPMPLRGLTFMNFKHVGDTVVVPVDALQFLDDLSILQAWLDRNGCDGSLLPNYVFNHAVTTGRTMSPLLAFGIDRDAALRDTFIDDVSYKYYETAAWFLLAHEVGHVALGQTGPASIGQEDAADAFALETMRRKRLPPAGIVLYMIATSLSDKASAIRSHASSGDRLSRVAAGLRTRPEEFVAASSRKPAIDRARVLSIADTLSTLAATLKTIESREASLAAGGNRLADVRAQIFPKVNYQTACVPKGS